MEKGLSILVLLMLAPTPSWLGAAGDQEVDALAAFKGAVADPTNILQSWDTSLVSPCTWLHITCNPGGSVTRIDLGNANLSGALVPELGKLPSLQYLELYNNHLSGGIPDELGNLTGLVSLDLYSNSLVGSIPNSLGKLKSLGYMRLNNNSLNGSIPKSLTEVEALQVLDLSNNNLSGDIPITGSFTKFTNLSFQGNKGLVYALTPPPPPAAPTPSDSSRSKTGIIAGAVAGGIVLLFFTLALAVFFIGRGGAHARFFDIPGEEEPEVNFGQLKRFSLRELQVATDHFSPKNILGRGGFGKVYKGRLANGALVAVKRLKEEHSHGGELQFHTELKMISLAVHRNLLKLLGFCTNATERLLVYPYMANGSLASRLRGTNLHSISSIP
ncbi:hypothetical protein SAY87_019680 [Trapa incisa]|uniref:Protein kinase domain-containing protein n=1 Tax=Trapa incisa TaxID=236973 RepID=A0AAN7K2N3_9MYRT|nr:hypothetical protein SAY87_019680 [Trapa incisa]